MIKSFKDKKTAQIFAGQCPKGMDQKLARQAKRKLIMVDEAKALEDLAAIPGNRFKALGGDRLGQYSIRINRQYRVCFAWDDGALDVEVTDYH